MNRIHKFLAWWLTGLMLLLPETLRQRFLHVPDRLTIKLDGHKFTLKLYRGNSNEPVDDRSFLQDDALEKQSTLQWLNNIRDDNTVIIVVIPRQKVLTKSLVLPLASESNLREILGFEMDRQTPFTVDRVYYDSKIIARDTDNQNLQLELFIALRDFVDPILDEVRSWPLQPKVIAISHDNTNEHDNINLLPSEARPPSNNNTDPLTLGLAVCASVLLIAVLVAPLIQQQQILETLKSHVDNSRNQAKKLLPLTREKEKIQTRNQFLTEKRQSQIPVIEILDELTRILPDDTWLNRMIIRDNEVQLHGESDAATSIIQILENSALFTNAQFRSPVTQNNATNKDKFHLSTTIIDGNNES